jgi:acetyl-CoA carboxylase biotin carboxyl carrier protein
MKRGTGQTSSGGAGVAPPVVHVHSTGAAAPAVAHTAPTAGPDAAASGDVIASPMVGTFYRSPSPDSDPFVTPGSRVSEDTVLCIIEAMKVMNEIRSEVEGEILEVLVENGEPVEFGQPLFLIQKG